jgi:hypothetical protein
MLKTGSSIFRDNTEGSGAGLIDDPAFTGASISRCPDGTDTQQNNLDLSLHLSTPGAANACLPAVVINEMDYDQPGTDTAEFIEIRNNDLTAVDLSTLSLEFVNGSGGGAAQYRLFTLSAVLLAPGDYFVLCANAANTPNCDQDVTPETDLIQNGAPDALALRFGATLIDAVSYEGNTGAPYTEGSGTGLLDDGVSATQGIARCADGVDTHVNNVDLSLRSITPGAANNCVTDVPPTVASTNPLNGATDASISTNITINFSEDVTATGAWYDITCSLSGAHTAVVSGGLSSYTLNPDTDFANGDVCTVTIVAAGVTDLDGTIDNMAADYVFSFSAFDVCAQTFTPIYDIQGSGPAAAIIGTVTTPAPLTASSSSTAITTTSIWVRSSASPARLESLKTKRKSAPSHPSPPAAQAPSPR